MENRVDDVKCPVVYVVMGAPAAGKSTRLMQSGHRKRICADDFYPVENGRRFWFDGQGMKKSWRNDPINSDILERATRWFFHSMGRYLRSRCSFWVESLFASRRERLPFLQLALGIGYEAHCLFMNSDIEYCLIKNRGRADSVPDSVIINYFAKLESPDMDEGWTTITSCGGG